MTGRRFENLDRIISRLGSASIAELDAQVQHANARLLGPVVPTLRERWRAWFRSRADVPREIAERASRG